MFYLAPNLETLREHRLVKLCALVSVLLLCMKSQAQNPPNWTTKQLEEPADLAHVITSKTHKLHIISVGPDAIIPNSVDIGMVDNPQGLEKLKSELKTIQKDDKIVIYCGCCPFEHCPNV